MDLVDQLHDLVSHSFDGANLLLMVLIAVKSLDRRANELNEDDPVPVARELLKEKQVRLQLVLEARDRVVRVDARHDDWSVVRLEEGVEVLVLTGLTGRVVANVHRLAYFAHVASETGLDLLEAL